MATLRIEFVKILAPVASPMTEAVQKVLSESELAVTGTATASGSQPAAPAGTTHAILSAVGGQMYVDWTSNKAAGSAPDPTTAKRIWLAAGDRRLVLVNTMKGTTKFSAVTAALT